MAGGARRGYLRHLPGLVVCALGCIALLVPVFLWTSQTTRSLKIVYSTEQETLANATSLDRKSPAAGAYGLQARHVGIGGSKHVSSVFYVDGSKDQDATPREVGLSARIPPITAYAKAKKKGQKLLCALKDPSHAGAAATSPWTSVDQLEEWGWLRDVRERDDEMDYSHVTRYCRGLAQRIGTDLAHGKQRMWVHHKQVEKNGVTYFATGGEYINVYWPEQGTIMANDNYSPAYQAERGEGSKKPFKDDKGKPLPLPKLKQWSDVNALTYASLAPNMHNLRFIFRRNIQNKATTDLIEKALKKNDALDGKKAPLWPGKMLTPASKGFAALVASPNVGGICWMLIQHGGILGRKDIKSITIWRDVDVGAQYAPNLLVELGDVEG